MSRLKKSIPWLVTLAILWFLFQKHDPKAILEVMTSARPGGSCFLLDTLYSGRFSRGYRLFGLAFRNVRPAGSTAGYAR